MIAKCGQIPLDIHELAAGTGAGAAAEAGADPNMSANGFPLS